MKGIFVLAILIYGNIPDGECSEDENRLINSLIGPGRYNNLVRPVESPSDSLNVTLGLSLLQIMKVNEKANSLTTHVWITMEWTDSGLVWDSSKYGGIADIQLPVEKIWKPDIYLYNNQDSNYGPMFPTPALVRSNGSITHVSPFKLKSSCALQPNRDEQTCEFKFGSWTSDAHQLNLVLAQPEGDTSSFVRNSKWELVGFPAERNSVHYACCDEPYVDITFKLKFKRIRNKTSAVAHSTNIPTTEWNKVD